MMAAVTSRSTGLLWTDCNKVVTGRPEVSRAVWFCRGMEMFSMSLQGAIGRKANSGLVEGDRSS